LIIYGNSEPRRLVSEMIKKKREPHSIMIHGEKGLGKKTLARWIAAVRQASLAAFAGRAE
jgi:DNA polymerase-3 subunit delta'